MNKYIQKLFLFSDTDKTKESMQMYWDETKETNKHQSAPKKIKFSQTWNSHAISKLWKEFALIN